MIRVEGVDKRIGDRHILKGLSFEVQGGEVFAYLGPNGAGKTTTIRILTGMSRQSGGDVWLGGRHTLREPTAAKAMFGLVPQSVSLDRDLSVAENLDVHCRLRRMGRAERRAAMAAKLEYVGLETERDSLVKDLSGGQKRRAMIARALLHRPRILFLDEPSAGLDPAIRRKLWALVKRIREEGTTVFLTTHYIEEAEMLADRVAFLDAGRIVALDAPDALRGALGEWAVDGLDAGQAGAAYFGSRQAAEAHLVGHPGAHAGGYRLRRINLEDAFLAMTGKPCSTRAT